MPHDSKDNNSIIINIRHQEQIAKVWRDRCTKRALDFVNNFYRTQHLRQLA